MAMRLGRTLPPAAAPLHITDLVSGLAGLCGGTTTVERLQTDLKNFYGTRYCFALSSGKAALLLVLQALKGLFPGRDEVLIPAYTCYSVPSVIVRAGLGVRLCDMAPDSLDFDFDILEERLKNPRLLCVIPTHLFGMPADVDRVKKLARKHDVIVVEDAAQAMGGEWNGRKLGTVGDVGVFSLGRGKAVSTVEGGIILTRNDMIGEEIGKRLKSIDHYGPVDCMKLVFYAMALLIFLHPSFYWMPKSLPFLKLGETRFDPSFPVKRLSSFQAGMAAGWKAKINQLKKKRLKNSQKVAAHGIKLPGAYRAIPDLIRFPVLIEDVYKKKKILEQSEDMGLGICDGYPTSIDGIRDLGQLPDRHGFPRAKSIAEKIITVPVHPLVRQCDLQKILHLLRRQA